MLEHAGTLPLQAPPPVVDEELAGLALALRGIRDPRTERVLLDLCRRVAAALELTAPQRRRVEQLARLQIEECANGQGYLFARPLEASAIGELIAATPELAKERR